MSKRKHSETSQAAYNSLKLSEVKALYQKIISALQVLGCAHTEKIAEYLTIEHPKVHKRISEMEKAGTVFKPGTKLPMKSGRDAYLWQLTSAASPKTEKEINYKKVDKTFTDYANAILENTKSTQPTLF